MAAEVDYSIITEFQGQIVRPKTSVFYLAGLLLVAATMLLLPLIYMALVGVVAYAVYYHAVHDFLPIMNLGGTGSVLIFKFLIYLAPLLAGAVVVFFLFKPLLARAPKRAQPLALNPANERLLYAFIEKICGLVGAPSPKRIDLDCQLNAAAGFRRGFFSMFGNDLVLVLGLPLVANLTARELAGVIAHEFGHFTQGAGMRLSYIINRINFWFVRVVYHRDSWDVALQSWVEDAKDGRVAMLVWTVQLSVWFSRLLLKILMLIGHAVCGFMMRQMEYDADAYEIKVSGSDCFEQTTRKLATLEAAWNETQKQLVNSWRKSRTLPDNLPELIRSSHKKLPEALLKKIDDTLGFRRTGLFDSHPSPADRIRQARRAGAPGIFHDERPASCLFASFEHPSRFVTLLHYTDDIGLPVTEQMLARVEVQPEGPGGALVLDNPSHSYFLGILPLIKPFEFPMPVASEKLDADYAELNQLTGGLQQISAQLEDCVRQDAELLEQLTSARAAHVLLSNGFDLAIGAFSLPGTTLESAAAAENEASAERQALRHSLREVAATLNRRLVLGLSLALANVGEATLVNGGESIPKIVGFINEQRGSYLLRQELAEALLTLKKINAVKSQEGENSAMRQALADQQGRVLSLVSQLSPLSESGRSASGGARLQVVKTLDAAVIESENQEWLDVYDRHIDQLVRFAMPAESFVPAR